RRPCFGVCLSWEPPRPCCAPSFPRKTNTETRPALASPCQVRCCRGSVLRLDTHIRQTTGRDQPVRPGIELGKVATCLDRGQHFTGQIVEPKTEQAQQSLASRFQAPLF